MVAVNTNFNTFGNVEFFMNFFSGFGNDFEFTSDGVFCRIVPTPCPICVTQMDHNGHNKHTKKNLG